MNNKMSELSNNLVEYSRKAKILEKNEEYKLITLWVENQDQKALQKIHSKYS